MTDETPAADLNADRSALIPAGIALPFILVTSCFALWGFANDVTNPMVKAFSKILLMSNFEGSLVQFAFYGGYFAMAFPAALFIIREHRLDLGRLGQGARRRALQRERRHQPPDLAERLHVVLESAVRDRRFARVRRGAAQFLGRDMFVRHRLHHVGTGNEHVRSVFDHEYEVGHRGRIHRPACAWPHDHADLRNHAGRQGIAKKNVRVAPQRHDALLDPGTTRVVQSNDRRADFHGHVHDFTYFPGIHFGQGTTEYRKILGKDINQSAVDPPETGDHTVADNFLIFHTEIVTAMLNKTIDFFKRSLVHQEFDPFPCRHLARFMLTLDPVLPTT